MRTIADIEADLEKLKDGSHLHGHQENVENVDATQLAKLNEGTPEEVWLAKQFQGHVQTIFLFSTLDPIPLDQTRMAISGLQAIARIVAALGWEHGDSYTTMADDMMAHFDQVTQLKQELLELTKDEPPATFSAGAANTTLH